METFKKTLEEAQAGDNTGALVKGVKREELRRGMVLVKPGSYSQNKRFGAQIYLLSKEEGGQTRPMIDNSGHMMFSLTWNFPCTVDLAASEGLKSHKYMEKDKKGRELGMKDRKMVMPGEDAHVVFNFTRAMPVDVGQRFTLRSGINTVGTGIVTKLLPDDD